MPENKEKKPSFYEQFAQKVIEHLKAGTAPWQNPWHPDKALSAPHNPLSGTVYRGMNRVSLALSGYDDPRWMTLKQANENGMRVKGGSKATPVVYFRFTEETNKLDKDGNPVLGEDGNPVKQTVKLDKPIVHVAHVFNAEQISGMPPLELTDKAFGWDPVEKAETILSTSGANINHDQRDRAFYNYATDSIHLPPRENFEEPGLYYGTALHELGHWTGHSTRQDREHGPFGSEIYAREELRAEIASWMLSQDIGVPHDPNQHAAYVNSWLKALEDDPYEIVRVCRDAEQIKEYVMGLEHVKQITLDQAEQDVEIDTPGHAFRKWSPAAEKKVEKVLTLAPAEEFAKAIGEAGLDLGGRAPVMDGNIHRVPVEGYPKRLDGTYCGYLDGRPAGWIQNFVTGEKTKWVATGHVLSAEERAAQLAEVEKRRQEREESQARLHNNVALDSQKLLEKLSAPSSEHAYLKEKGILPLGDIRQSDEGLLYVPIQNINGEVRGYQTIDAEGNKRYARGMEKRGNFHSIAMPSDKNELDGKAILLAEGYATAVSLHTATSLPVVAAFDSGNLEPAAKALHEEYPNTAITICADNDHSIMMNGKAYNVGLEKAFVAALAVDGKVIVPEFTEEEKKRGCTDFNDLFKSRGRQAVEKMVLANMKKHEVPLPEKKLGVA